VKYYFAVAAVLICVRAAAEPPRDTAAGEQRFRELYKELVETNTTLSAGSCTLAAARMAARLKARLQRPITPRRGGSWQCTRGATRS